MISHRSWSADAEMREGRQRRMMTQEESGERRGQRNWEAGDVILCKGYTPVHGAIYDLFFYLDRVVLAIDFRQRWNASHRLPEEPISHRQNV